LRRKEVSENMVRRLFYQQDPYSFFISFEFRGLATIVRFTALRVKS
jgi:hypothetical protein